VTAQIANNAVVEIAGIFLRNQLSVHHIERGDFVADFGTSAFEKNLGKRTRLRDARKSVILPSG
jgi:hypothetical protein